MIKRTLYSTQSSVCCGAPMQLVQSRRGGFVSRNCVTCGEPDEVTLSQLPRISCEICKSELQVKKGARSNYQCVCKNCQRAWLLGDLVPHWSELFPYWGLAAHGDGIY